MDAPAGVNTGGRPHGNFSPCGACLNFTYSLDFTYIVLPVDCVSSVLSSYFHCVFKTNQNAPRPSEHPPVRGKKISDYLYVDSPVIVLFCTTVNGR